MPRLWDRVRAAWRESKSRDDEAAIEEFVHEH
jgi:hypothetical protein